jgi:cysteine-rich repeat protein
MRSLLLLCLLPLQLLAQSQPTSTCGDGIIEGFEACDAGSANNDAGPCLPSCVLLVLTQEARCGDKMLDSGESCDDGNNINGDGCRADCLGVGVCGDAVLDDGESCDDGNQVDGDTCAADCQQGSTCGDGIVSYSEICDDGNTQNGDDCSADCRSTGACHEGLASLREGSDAPLFLRAERAWQLQGPISATKREEAQRAYRVSLWSSVGAAGGLAVGFVTPRIYEGTIDGSLDDIGPGGTALLVGSRVLAVSSLLALAVAPSVGHFMLDESARGWKFLGRRAALVAVAAVGYSLSTLAVGSNELAPGSKVIAGVGLASAIVLPIAVVRHIRDVRMAPFREAAGSYAIN